MALPVYVTDQQFKRVYKIMFKRNPKSATQLAEQLQQLSGSQKFEKDPAEWTITTDKAGNGSATIRFLPAKGENGEVVPFVKVYNHSFKDPATGKWYIENCPTTLGRPYDDCPVCRSNGPLYEAGKNGDKASADLASKRSRKLSYWANIVVIKDENNPEAQGKVFKYRFGKKIFEKIQAMADSKIEEIPSMDVTDVFEGANFYLKVKQVSGFANYDDSTFGPQSELFKGDEDKLKAVWDGMHSLKEITADKHFKATTDLEKSYARATGATAARKPTAMEREVAEAQREAPTRVHQQPAVEPETDDIPFDDKPSEKNGAVEDDIDAFLSSLE